MKHILYKLFLFLFQVSPFPVNTAKILRRLKFPLQKLYKDLRFQGVFPVHVSNEHSFQLTHFGGTIENEIFWKGLGYTWESHTIWLWIELCKEANLIVDIGANRGVYSLIATCLNSEAEIIAFEPSRGTYDKLVQNVRVNKFQITCEQVALSNHTGTATFHDSFDANQTSATLSEVMVEIMQANSGTVQLNDYQVNVETLDNYCLKQNKKIDLIKLDVEMHEPEVIEGYLQNLYVHQPIILIEILSETVAGKLNAVIDDRYLKVHLTEQALEIKSQLEVVPLAWNYLLVPKSKKIVLEKLISLQLERKIKNNWNMRIKNI